MYDAGEQAQLLEVAEASIRHGLQQGRALEVDPLDYPPSLRQPRATFVTLNRHGELRGCIGSLEAHRPLISDVAHNAWSAAFRDPRFPPLATAEWPGLELHISILSPPEPLAVESRASLIASLRPGIDGLIVEEGGRRGTFLPSVWESLGEPHAFVSHLMLKAGLPADYWSQSLRISRYTTESFGRAVREPD
jgi:AmmeMemoRadiSam system protein A